MKSKKYHSLNNSKIQQKNKKYHTEQLQDSTEKQKIPHCLNNSKIQQKNKKYHTVWTTPRLNRKTKNTTLSEQLQDSTEK